MTLRRWKLIKYGYPFRFFFLMSFVNLTGCFGRYVKREQEKEFMSMMKEKTNTSWGKCLAD